MDTVLKMTRIRKSFAGIEVLHGVDLELYTGEVLALIGENGAGKSTLMKVLMGIEQADSGSVTFLETEVEFNGPAQALKAGIAMIHQELYPIPNMTIAENLLLGREISRFGFVNAGKQERETTKWLDMMGLDISPHTKMKDLSISEMQIVEIAKALSYGSKVLIFDEPTSAITTSEVQRLFEVIDDLKSQQISIVYISHKLDELPFIADRVQVLRDGGVVSVLPISKMSREEMIRLMVNREINDVYPLCKNTVGEPVLEVKNLTRMGEFRDVSFTLCSGEKLGIAGLMGAGRTEIVSTIFGDRRPESGEVLLFGKHYHPRHPSDAIKRKVAFITEDRKLLGLNLKASVRDNISACIDRRESNFGFVNNRRISQLVRDQVKKLSIRTASMDQVVENLSGGNQQKVVIAKWLLIEPEIILFDEPTRGIDVGAKTEIYHLINSLAIRGKSIIVISSEMPELLGISDRIIVMNQGRLSGELHRNEFSQEAVMALAAHDTNGGTEQ